MKTSRRHSSPPTVLPGAHGDAAIRAMFDRWERENHDPKPMGREKFQAIMEKNRLREAPLFAPEPSRRQVGRGDLAEPQITRRVRPTTLVTTKANARSPHA